MSTRIQTLEAEVEHLRRHGADIEAAYAMSSESLDRFRDVICQALDLDENPGDSDLVYRLLAAHGKADEPESTRWRDFLTGQLARLTGDTPTEETA